MNKDWSQKNKEIQTLLGKKATYKEGIQKLISFREELFEQISAIVNSYPKKAFYQMPFPNANGYHNKTLAYSIWHIFRIEDIVAHEMLKRIHRFCLQVLMRKASMHPLLPQEMNWKGRRSSPFPKR